MPDSISPGEIRQELHSHLPYLSTRQLEELTEIFVEFSAGKYVSGRHWEIGKRNTEIRHFFTGHNYQELAHRFGLSCRHIRRLLKKN